MFSFWSLFQRASRYSGSTIWNHKFKSFVVIAGILAAYKIFGMYKAIRMALNPFSDMQIQGGDEEEAGEGSTAATEENKN